MHDQLFEALQNDHREVLSLFGRLQESSEESGRKALLEQLLREILPHMVGEEQIVYPALRPEAAAWGDAREAIGEHHAAQKALQELTRTPPGDAAYRERLADARDLVERHIRREEETIFADLKRVLSERHAGQILEGFRREKDLARTRYPDLPIVSAGVGEIREERPS